jgi:hypothetical protein
VQSVRPIICSYFFVYARYHKDLSRGANHERVLTGLGGAREGLVYNPRLPQAQRYR